MLRKTMLLLLAMGAALVLAALPASAQKQTLHMAYWAGPSHQMVQTLESWVKSVEEASGGNLTIEQGNQSTALPTEHLVAVMLRAVKFRAARFDQLGTPSD